MLKKWSIIIIFCLSLLLIAGCGKSASNGTSKNLQNCRSTCDQLSVMYKDAADTYKTSCYSNCEKIEAKNQGNWRNVDENNADDGTKDTADNEETTTTEEVMTESDCDTMCHSNIRLTATAEERAGCALSCKVGIKVGSNDINDCNNIETFSEGMFTKDSCIASKAISQKKVEYCKIIQDEQTIAGCYIGIAQANNDKSICNKIENEENKAYCNVMLSQE